MKRVLVLSAHFPPISGARSVGAAKLLKHLPSNGWIPDIVCSEGDPVFGAYAPLTRDIPSGVTVFRVRDLLDGKRTLPRRLHVPDYRALWVLPAASVAIRLAKKNDYDALLSLSFPASSHVAGLIVHQTARLPWIAFFGDLWMQSLYTEYRQGSLGQIAGSILERAVIRRAQRVGAVTKEMRDLMARAHPVITEKSIVIPNACELIDIERAAVSARPADGFTLLHAGPIYGIRDPDYLVQGFAEFRRRHPEAKAKLRFVGSWSLPLDREVMKDPALHGALEIVQAKSWDGALAEMCAASVLVLIDPSPVEPGISLPRKFVEYMMTGRPILALTVPGPVTRAIDRYDAGAAVRYDDVQSISDAIADLYSAHDHGSPPRPRSIPELEAATASKALAGHLDALA